MLGRLPLLLLLPLGVLPAGAVDALLRERVVRPATSNYTTLGRLDLPFVAVYSDAFYWRGVLLTNGSGSGSSAAHGLSTNRWTTNSDIATINAEHVTNAVELTAGDRISITATSGRAYTIAAGSGVVVELTNGAVTTPWIYTDDIDNDITNILIHYPVPATGLYTVNLAFHTITSNALEQVDSVSMIYVSWTSPDNFAWTAPWIDGRYEVWWNRLSGYAPMVVNCLGGTSLIVSNFVRDSFYSPDGDTPSTNFIRASLTGPKP